MIDWRQYRKFSLAAGPDGDSILVCLYGSVEVPRTRRMYESGKCNIIAHVTASDRLVGYEILLEKKPKNILCLPQLAFWYHVPPKQSDRVTAVYETRFIKVFETVDRGNSGDVNGLVTLKYAAKGESK